MQIVHSLTEQTWRQFIENQPTSNVFHTPEMFQVFERAKGYKPALWAAVNNDGQVRALLSPVQLTLRNGLLRRLTTRAVVYGSVLCQRGPMGSEALAKLLRTYIHEIGREALFTELRNLSNLSAVQPVLNECGFVYEDHLNYLIDLNRPAEEILHGFGRRTRKRIRRGSVKQDVVVEEVTERSQLVVCYDLLQKSYTTAQVPLADLSLFESAFDVLYHRGMIKFWLARVGHAYVATSVELLYKSTIYGWFGGVDRAYSSYVPSELLMWHILKWGMENGYQVYDLGGAGKPNEEYGVRAFKAKFGGELVCFGRNTNVHTLWLLKLSKWGYALYRKFL